MFKKAVACTILSLAVTIPAYAEMKVAFVDVQEYSKFLTENPKIKVIAVTPMVSSDSSYILDGSFGGKSVPVAGKVYTSTLIITYEE